MSYVYDYAVTLAEGGALNVRRLGQRCDWDEDHLRNALNEAIREYNRSLERWGWGGVTKSRLDRDKGIHHALALAYAEAGDRAYNRRRRRPQSGPTCR